MTRLPQNAENEKVQARIFIGYLITPEFRQQLDKSPSWRQAMIAWQSEKNGICEIDHEGKHYLGVFVSQITMNELKGIVKQLEEKVLSHCSEISPKLLQSRIFSQMFIS